MDNLPIRQVDFVCPFQAGNMACPELMSPMRKQTGNREKKLFVLMNKPQAPTKNACPRCSVFLNAWKEQVKGWGHVRYLLTWWKDKQVREPAPQENL